MARLSTKTKEYQPRLVDMSTYDVWGSRRLRAVAKTPEQKHELLVKALHEIAKIGHQDGVERYIARAALMLTGELK
jgi:hypothetical protein